MMCSIILVMITCTDSMIDNSFLACSDRWQVDRISPAAEAATLPGRLLAVLQSGSSGFFRAGVTEACWNRTYMRQLSRRIGATVAEAEFVTFYRAEMLAVIRHVMNHGASEQEAVDATQTAFVQAYQVWETIGHPRAWVRTVATRRSCALCRGAGRSWRTLA
jgi:hypothetical protein